jgi:hypothetical protein
MSEVTAVSKMKLDEFAKPFEAITIHADKTYTRAEVQNQGVVQFLVEFPAGQTVCEIKLDISFATIETSRHVMKTVMLRGTGGTVVIGG